MLKKSLGWLEPFFAGMFLPILVFASLPVAILLVNFDEFTLATFQGFYQVAGEVVLAVALINALLLALLKERRYSRIVRFFSFLAASIIFSVILASVDVVNIWTDVLAVVVAIVIATAVPWPVLKRFSSAVAVTLLTFSLFNFLPALKEKEVATARRQLAAKREAEERRRKIAEREAAEKLAQAERLAKVKTPFELAREKASRLEAQKGNVYHIILDGFQSEAFHYLLRAERGRPLEDFVFYRDFQSGQPYTEYALSSLFFGRWYTWNQTYWKDGWCKSLEQQGITLWGYVFKGEVRPECFHYYRTTDDIPMAHQPLDAEKARREEEEAERARVADANGGSFSVSKLVDIAFQRAIPPTVTRMLSGGGTSGFDDIGFSLSGELGKPVVTRFHFGYLTLQNWKQMLREEAERPAHGQYVFQHQVIPHTPYVFDREGNLQLPPKKGLGAYMDMADFSISLVADFVAELKKQGKYDDALIIVHGDHGFGWKQEDFEEWLVNPAVAINRVSMHEDYHPGRRVFSSDDIDAKSSALLLVKFRASAGSVASGYRCKTAAGKHWPDHSRFLWLQYTELRNSS